MHSFNMHFAQAQTHNDNRVQLQAGFINIKTPIRTDRSAVFKDQALEETVLTLFHPMVHSCFQLVGVRIHLPVTMSLKANSQK